MFKLLKEKLTSWFKKKPEEKPEKKKSKSKKIKIKLKKPEEELEVPELPKEITAEVEREEPKKEGFFSKLASRLSTSTITQEQFDELFQELQITLLENNVAFEVVEKIHDELAKDLVGIEVKKSEIKNTIINSLKETIKAILIEPPDLLNLINKKQGPFTMLFVGINGSGKTTTIAKLANFLKQHKISCVLAAGDTFRAASIEQLQKHAEALDLPIIKHK